jgi:membrane associated rhomboid family serine protease
LEPATTVESPRRRLAERIRRRDGEQRAERPELELTGRLSDRALLTRYGVAWLFFAGFVVTESAFLSLPGRVRLTWAAWASTNVVNLHHDPLGTLFTSAFISTSLTAAWPIAIALALFGANQVLGNWRTALLCVTGQVLGTLVSEGIVDFRVTHHLLPAASASITDVGPSYVVMSVIAVAAFFGTWPIRIAATIDLAVLIFASRIFSGLTHLDVAAVGHLTALTVSVVLGTLLVRNRRRRLLASERL